MYRNLLGAALAICLFLPAKKSNITKNALLLIISLILIDQVKLYQTVKQEIRAHLNFPVLADFEQAEALRQWSGHSLTQSSEHKLTGQYSMKVKLMAGGQYSGFSFKHFPADWSDYQQITFSLFNPGQSTIRLNIKITDFEHDLYINQYNSRFNRQIRLINGWNQITIPLDDIITSPENRKLDITEISRVGFFMSHLKNNQIIYIDNMRLL